MNTIHRIRLRGAWEIETLDATRVRCSRNFGKPRTLDPHESVWLFCESTLHFDNFKLNDTPIGSPGNGPLTIDITSIIQPRNVLILEGPSSEITQGVALEIRG